MRSLALPLRAALLSASVIGLAVLSAPAARAQTQIYTSLSDFLGDVQPNYYSESFTGNSGAASSYSFLSNAYGYTVTASAGTVFRSGTDIETNTANRDLVFTFTTGNVTALGGNFYNTNALGFVAQPVTLTLNDGTTRTFTPNNMNVFRGITTDIPITSLTFEAPGGVRTANVDNFIVGSRITPTAAPEPGTVALIAVGALPLAGAIARRRKRA